MASRHEFELELAARGFVSSIDEPDFWIGPIPVPDRDGQEVSAPHRILLRPGFPFVGPKIRPENGPLAPQWHMEHDGTLCVFPDSGWPAPPWDDVDQLFEKVAGWYTNHYAGWPDDPGDLDLERYFEAEKVPILVAFDNLDSLVGNKLEVEQGPNELCVIVRRRRRLGMQGSHASRKREAEDLANGRPWAAGVDIGTIDRPVSSWESVMDKVSQHDRAAVRTMAQRNWGLLVVRYTRQLARGNITGAASFRAERDPITKQIVLKPTSVENRVEARRNRQGSDAEMLGTKRIAIVGCGAIGSFLADLLVRSGLGAITLIDGESLRFGNCKRHLADERYVPRPKVNAVKEVLVERHLVSPDTILAETTVLSHDNVIDRLKDHDLVIDTSANAQVFTLIDSVAEEVGCTWLTVGLCRGGAVVRADRAGSGTPAWDQRPEWPEEVDEDGVPETGCGDPVSSTPPSSVTAAASLAYRMAVDTLRPRARRSMPDYVIETLWRHDAPRYGELGIVS